MKTTGFLTTLAIILFSKIVNGQHNALVYNDNFETTSPVLQQQPIITYAMGNSMQDLLNQSGNTTPLSNHVNQLQTLIETNTPSSSPSTQQIQLPPELQQQPLQVQQYLQLQKPLQPQQALPMQPSLQLQPQTHMQPLLQSQHPLQIQFDAQPTLLPPQAQETPQLQPQTHKQLQLQSHHPLQVQPSLYTQQSSQTPQPLMLQQTLHSLDPLPVPQQVQQRIECQQNSPLNSFVVAESKNIPETSVKQLISNNQPNSEMYVNWKSSNPQVVMNLDIPHNTQNFNVQPLQKSINHPVDAIANVQISGDKPPEIPPLRYYILSQQPIPPSASTASTPVVPNSHSNTNQPCNYIKSTQETYSPHIAPYSYVTPIPEVQHSVPERTKSVNSIPPTPSILATPSPSTQTATNKLHYYNQATESGHNVYVNQNLRFRYGEQSQIPVALQSQTTALMPIQSSIFSSIPISVLQPPSISPHYRVSSNYPVSTIVAPVYPRHKSVSSKLKSLLPLIFQLIQKKNSSCRCKNDCPCECKNDCIDNELEVVSGYSSQKDYGSLDGDALPVLDTESEEVQGPECLREPKNCENVINASSEESDEVLEEESSDEEEADEDESD